MAQRTLRSRFLHPFVVMPLVVALAVGVWWFVVRDEPSDPSPVATTSDQVVEVTKGPMNSTVSAEGTVAAAATDDLSFTSAGTVTAVNVKAGDTVTAGQVLATMDSAELAADVATAESAVADAKAKLADDRAGDASDEQIAADIASVATANDSLAKAQQALDGTRLVATIDGTVASVDLTVGERLGSGGDGGTGRTGSDSGSGRSSGDLGSGNNGRNGGNGGNGNDGATTAQIQVVSTGHFEVDLAVDAADIGSVAEGQPAKVTVTSSSSGRGRFGGFFPGGVAFGPGGRDRSVGSTGPGGGDGGTRATSGAGSTAEGTVTAVSRVATATSGVATYAVTVGFDDASGDIFVGSTVTADIVTASRPDVVQVPSRAVTTDDDGSTVELALDGTATGRVETRRVTVGTTLDGQTEITSGLLAGDKVLVEVPNFGRLAR